MVQVPLGHSGRWDSHAGPSAVPVYPRRQERESKEEKKKSKTSDSLRGGVIGMNGWDALAKCGGNRLSTRL